MRTMEVVMKKIWLLLTLLPRFRAALLSPAGPRARRAREPPPAGGAIFESFVISEIYKALVLSVHCV